MILRQAVPEPAGQQAPALPDLARGRARRRLRGGGLRPRGHDQQGLRRRVRDRQRGDRRPGARGEDGLRGRPPARPRRRCCRRSGRWTGVRTAEGSVFGTAQIIGKDGKPAGVSGPPALGFNWSDDADLNPLRIIAGVASARGRRRRHRQDDGRRRALRDRRPRSASSPRRDRLTTGWSGSWPSARRTASRARRSPPSRTATAQRVLDSEGRFADGRRRRRSGGERGRAGAAGSRRCCPPDTRPSPARRPPRSRATSSSSSWTSSATSCWGSRPSRSSWAASSSSTRSRSRWPSARVSWGCCGRSARPGARWCGRCCSRPCFIGLVASIIGIIFGIAFAAILRAGFNAVGASLPGDQPPDRAAHDHRRPGGGHARRPSSRRWCRRGRPAASARRRDAGHRGRRGPAGPPGRVHRAHGAGRRPRAARDAGAARRASRQRFGLIGLGAVLLFVGAAMLTQYVRAPAGTVIGAPDGAHGPGGPAWPGERDAQPLADGPDGGGAHDRGGAGDRRHHVRRIAQRDVRRGRSTSASAPTW